MNKKVRMILECPSCKQSIDKFLTRDQVNFIIDNEMEMSCIICKKEVKMTLLTDDTRVPDYICRKCW